MKKSIGVLGAVAAALVLSVGSVWADAGWVVRAYGDNAFVTAGGLWTNRGDRVRFEPLRLPRPPQPAGMSFLARTGFETATAGRHTFRLDVSARDKMGHLLVVDGRRIIEFPDGIDLAAGRHTLALYVREALMGTKGGPCVDVGVVMDGAPLEGLSFNVTDETAKAVVYDRVFEMKDGLRKWNPAWRTFTFEVPEDGLYEFPVRYRAHTAYPRNTRLWLDDSQVLYAQGRRGVDTRNAFRGDLDRSERTDLQRLNFFGEDRVVRFLKKGTHSLDFYAHWSPWFWNDDMEVAAPKNVVLGLRRLTGVNPESETGFWIDGTDKWVFQEGETVRLVAQSAATERRDYQLEVWRDDGKTERPERRRVPFALEGGQPVRLDLPTTVEGEWRYAVKNARGETMDGPWEYAVVGNRVSDHREQGMGNRELVGVVVDRVDCREGAGGPHDFRERGESQIVETQAGCYRRVGLQGLGKAEYKRLTPTKGVRPVHADEKPDVTCTTHDWYAYTLKLKHPGCAHILRCQVPNDESRITTVVAYDRKTRNYNGFGMVSGDAPASGPFSNLDIFLWPNADVVDVMVINSGGNHGSKFNRGVR